MTHLAKITAVEARLFFREPGMWLVGILLPTFVLVVIGLIFGRHEPDPALGGRRYIDLLRRRWSSSPWRPWASTPAGAPREVPRAGRPAPAVDDPGRAVAPC